MTTEILLNNGEMVVHLLVPPGEYLIGRDEEADICIPDPSISKRHARLLVDHESVCLQDLGSGNGTYVEDMPAVGLLNLYDGQSATLGAVSLRVRQSTEPHALKTCARYRRGDMVAHGGMGAIHEARQASMGRKVAMKVMLRSWDESSLKRFVDEARITGMLEHPNIVPVHELGVDEEEQLFYTMKFVRGVTLAEVLAGLSLGNEEAARKYPLATLLTIFQKVCDAVAFAHSRTVWHRDLKPENVMIGDFGEVLVMDWGLAKEAGFGTPEASQDVSGEPAETSSQRTLEGTVMGTPAYMAPEQARGETSTLDHRADVYALGAILYEILHLQPRVRGETSAEIVQKVATGCHDAPEPRPALHLPGQRVPDSLVAVSRKAMAFEPERRYQFVQDLQADITAYQSGFATSAESASLGKHLALFVKRNRAASLAVSAGAALLLVSSVWFTVSVVRERNRAESAQRVAEHNEREAKLALQRALDMEGQARSSDRKAEAALGEKEEMRERFLGIYGSAEKAAAESSRRAQRLLAESRFDEAFAHIENALQLMPEGKDYAMSKANFLQAAGRFGNAAEIYRAVSALGEDQAAATNLELTERLLDLQGHAKKLKPDSVLLLEKALMDQRRELDLVLLHAAASGQWNGSAESEATAERELVDERARLEAKMAAYKRQAGWRADRLSQRPDGSWALDLSELEAGDLSVLRGENISGLNLRRTDIVSVEGLRGTRLVSLDLTGTKVEDLAPIRSMPLESLALDDTQVVSLEPLQDMPLRTLRVSSASIKDFSTVPSLKKLEELFLHADAVGVDTEGLAQLRLVEHPRFSAGGAISAAEFRKRSRAFDAAREEWMASLASCGVRDFPPDRMVMREPPGVDLDLRGLEIKDLAPLKDVPLRALWLGAGAPPDISGLRGHPTLRHLHLADSAVKEIAPLLDSEALQSVVLSRSTIDAGQAARSPHLKRIGYTTDEEGLLPRSTMGEFFAPRMAEREDMTPPQGAAWRFDDPGRGAAGWRISGAGLDAGSLTWSSDPPSEQGRGGGFLSVVNNPGGSGDPYFVAPPEVLQALRNNYGGVLEYDMRAPGIIRYLHAADVILEGAGLKLNFFAQVRPDDEWQTFLVPLREHPAWRKGGEFGPLASPAELRAVLERPTALRIRTQHAADGPGPRSVGFDDLKIWPASSAAARDEKLDRQRLASVAWGQALGVRSMETLERTDYEGLRSFREVEAVWVDGFEGRRGVLAVHPLEPERPAVITFRPGVEVPEGSKLHISGRGSFEEPGVKVVVRQSGRELGTFYMSRPWQNHVVAVPSSTSSQAQYSIEIAADGWNMEDAYFDEIALVLPDGSKKFARAGEEVVPARFPSGIGDLDGPWLWDAQGWRTALSLRSGSLAGHDWQFRLVGRRLLVLIGQERSVELRQSGNGNWYGVQYPERSSVAMERVDVNRLGQSAPPRTLAELNGHWVWDWGGGRDIFEFKRGKPQGHIASWKTRMEKGILTVELSPEKMVDLVPQKDGSWLGLESRTGYIIRMYRAK
jgi:serine/threonine protein kinase